MSWKSGVDVLSFGATKNGAMAAEAVVFFDRGLMLGAAERRKRAGMLVETPLPCCPMG
jgi:threonine aldolase